MYKPDKDDNKNSFKTVKSAGRSDGGGSEEISRAASGIYGKAKREAGGGDPALKSR